ncbi:serine/threonine-protein kinase [Vibrio gallaecicus]|uniref:serine/threonine-protein kinase n=1 Tax=Vibrio gallaecicus TaxID=552386 RepID=UPI0010C9CDC9|nr:serine/threonine-protein kinase [Vibrio gallaecicus]MDN3615686.1 serine/threonine-protein kinase [Vibrio gallaecicus]
MSAQSPTEVFYHLMDLSVSDKEVYLKKLKSLQPELFKQVSPLLAVNKESEQFTELLGFHAHQATSIELDLTNTLIHKYHITHELGRGGMGIVYAASRADKTFEQDLAIKFIQPALTHVLGKKSLFDEAQLLAHLNHPYIAKVFDGGVYEGSVYIVMERVEGQTLCQYLASTPLTQNKKLNLFKDICLAIEHAHQNQILHADLKPENILIDANTSPKILDFNLTQKVSQSSKSKHTLLTAYSKAYASPEQMAGDYLTQQSDVYSLGKILSLLFPIEKPTSDIAHITYKAIQHQIKDRYSTVAEMRLDIESLLACRPISQKAHLPFYTAKMLFCRRPVQCALSCLLLLSGTTLSSMLIYQNQQLAQEKQIAENMMYEVTSLLFHAKGSDSAQMSVNSMLELTRRRILSNPNIPKDIKQKMLLAMLTPTPEKQVLKRNCTEGCTTP